MNLPLKQYFDLLEKYLRPQWRRVTLLAVLLFGGIGLQLLTPQLVRNFIDTAQKGGAASELTRTGLFYLCVTLINQVMRTGASYVTEDVKWQTTPYFTPTRGFNADDVVWSMNRQFDPNSKWAKQRGNIAGFFVELMTNFPFGNWGLTMTQTLVSW